MITLMVNMIMTVTMSMSRFVSLKTDTLSSSLNSLGFNFLFLAIFCSRYSPIKVTGYYLQLVGSLHFLLSGGDVRDGVCELDGLQLLGLGPGGHPRLGVVVIPGLIGGVPLSYPLPDLTWINSSSLELETVIIRLMLTWR